MSRLVRQIAVSATLLALVQAVSACPFPYLPRIDPSGERIFLPPPYGTTLDPGLGTVGGGWGGWSQAPAWQSPPSPPVCGTPAAGMGWVPYSIYGAPGPLPAPPVAGPYSAPMTPPNPGGLSPTALFGVTSEDPRDGIPGQLSVNPSRLVAPVGQEVILRAGICGADGYLITGQPIEWSLSPDSVGTIVEVDQNNKSLWRHLFQRPPFKRSSDFAKGLTSEIAQIIPRGAPGPHDDLRLERGQTWISLTSASEGATHVTTVALKIAGWEQRRASTTIHWVDGQWDFPTPSLGNSESGTNLCTRIRRLSSGAPLAGWRVTYEVTGGTPVAFANGGQQVEVLSDAAGNACAMLRPVSGDAGVTYVRMRVTRTGLGTADPTSIHVGEGTTSVSWSPTAAESPPYVAPVAPANPIVPPSMPDQLPPSLPPGTGSPSTQPPSLPPTPPPGQDLLPPGADPQPTPAAAPELEIRVTGSPQAEKGEQVDYRIEIRNPDSAVAESIEVVGQIPAGLQYLGSSPPAAVFGDRLVWRRAELPGGESAGIDIRYGIKQGGRIQQCATITWRGGRPVEACATTEVKMNALLIDVRGPQSAMIGDTISYEIVVSNLSESRLDNVQVSVQFDDGLVYGVEQSPIEQNIGAIEPRQSRNLPIVFKVLGRGRLCFEVAANAGDGSSARTGVCVNAGQSLMPALTVQKLGPPSAVVGETVLLSVTVTNTGQVELTNLQFVDQFDRRLEPTDANVTVTPIDRERIGWKLDELRPGESRTVTIRCRANEAAERVCDRVTVTCDQGITQTDDYCLRIRDRSSGNRPQIDSIRPTSARNLESAMRESAMRLATVRMEPAPSMAGDAAAKKDAENVDGLAVTISPVAGMGSHLEKLTYYVEVENTGDKLQEEVVLTLETPSGTRYGNSLNPPMIRTAELSADRRTVEFFPIATLRSHEVARFRVVVIREQAAVGRMRAKVTSRQIPSGNLFSQ